MKKIIYEFPEKLEKDAFWMFAIKTGENRWEMQLMCAN